MRTDADGSENMRILIAGHVKSGQDEVLAEITGEKHEHESCEGLVLQHEFKNKYFSTNCGLWVDEYTDVVSWCSEFCSDEATEVREAVLMFIHTLTSDEGDSFHLADFIDKLQPHQPAYAVPLQGISSLRSEHVAKLESAGFDVVNREDISPLIDTALYDAVFDDKNDSNEEGQDEVRDPGELQNIMEQLKAARDSSTMTDLDKKNLAEKIAEQLVI